MSFDGSDAHLTIPKGLTSRTLELYATSDWSISMWLYLPDAGANDQFLIHGYKEGAPYDGYGLVWRKDNTLINFHDGDTTWTGMCGSLSMDAWHHLVLSHTGGDLTPYCNGSGGSASALSGEIDSGVSVTTLRIGSNVDGSAEFLTGKINEMAYFDVALTAGEVTAMYNGGTPVDLIDHRGIVSYWRFEEGSGTIVRDLVGSNHATIQNDATFSTSVPS